jgi:hypothetical protein
MEAKTAKSNAHQRNAGKHIDRRKINLINDKGEKVTTIQPILNNVQEQHYYKASVDRVNHVSIKRTNKQMK